MDPNGADLTIAIGDDPLELEVLELGHDELAVGLRVDIDREGRGPIPILWGDSWPKARRESLKHLLVVLLLSRPENIGAIA